MSPTLKLDLLPDWSAVKSAWDPTLAHLDACGIDEETAHLLAMASQELLENAVKYGAPRFGGQVELTLEVASAAVTIEVKSPAGDEDQVDKLDDTIQWIRGYQDPFEAYVEKLKQVSASPYQPGESGLGLTRIAYEPFEPLSSATRVALDEEAERLLEFVRPLEPSVYGRFRGTPARRRSGQ